MGRSNSFSEDYSAKRSLRQQPAPAAVRVLLGVDAGRPVQVARRGAARCLGEYQSQRGLFIQRIPCQSPADGARMAVTIPVVGIACAAERQQPVGAISQICTCLFSIASYIEDSRFIRLSF